MPLVWDEELFNKSYSQGYKRSSYYREGVGLVHHKTQMQGMEKTLPKFNKNSDMLVVGCGYGFLMEVMVDSGARHVWGTDISPYIQANKEAEARSDVAPLILDIDVVDTDAQAQFAAAGAGGQGANEGKFLWIISEHVVEGFNVETEAADLIMYLEGLDDLLSSSNRAGIIHLFAGLLPDDPHDHSLGLTWLPLEDWVPYAPHHYWIDTHAWRLGGGV